MAHEQWQKIVDGLRGSVDMLSEYPEGAEELFESNQQFCEFVDEQIFSCTSCGWWCDISEECSEEYALPELTCSQCGQEGQ